MDQSPLLCIPGRLNMLPLTIDTHLLAINDFPGPRQWIVKLLTSLLEQSRREETGWDRASPKCLPQLINMAKQVMINKVRLDRFTLEVWYFWRTVQPQKPLLIYINWMQLKFNHTFTATGLKLISNLASICNSLVRQECLPSAEDTSLMAAVFSSSWRVACLWPQNSLISILRTSTMRIIVTCGSDRASVDDLLTCLWVGFLR